MPVKPNRMATANHKEALARLLEQISADAKTTANWTGYPVFDDAVMKALELVPRHAFIAERDQLLAYANRPLGIGYGQTISQPYIVALMTVLLELKSCTNVLEVGTGCGYQTAVLAELVERVYTIEIVSDLAARAKKTLGDLGYNTVNIRIGNGREGWQEHAPFQAIIVTASSETIPPNLINQLDFKGRMVIPRGPQGGSQILILVTKDGNGTVTENEILPVSFVPLVA